MTKKLKKRKNKFNILTKERHFTDEIKTIICNLHPVVSANEFCHFSEHELFKLKRAFGYVNNAVTCRLTSKLAEWISNRSEFNEYKDKIIELALSHPNASGYDIKLEDPNILAEIKGNVPVNDGDKFGAAQKKGLKEDICCLLGITQGEKKEKELKIGKDNFKKYFKFLGLPNSHVVQKAMDELINAINKNQPPEEKIIFKKYTPENLNADELETGNRVHIVFLSVDNQEAESSQ